MPILFGLWDRVRPLDLHPNEEGSHLDNKAIHLHTIRRHRLINPQMGLLQHVRQRVGTVGNRIHNRLHGLVERPPEFTAKARCRVVPEQRSFV